MITFVWYLLKVIICSGILYGYYLLALRDKIFHKYNRFYLLAAVALSLASPIIKINIFQKAKEPKTQVTQLIQVVSYGDEVVFDYAKEKSSFHLDADNISEIIYTSVACLFFAIFIQALIKIIQLKRRYKATIVEGINFFNTNAKGTPFSFFNNIFWNDKIDMHTSTGKQIFQHEVAHVHEKHSYDKVFMNLVLIIFWCNPFYWLMRKELNIIHEFIADKKALEDNDTAAFAAMILQATYPRQQFIITNNFFYSPLKRRLAMLTKNKNPKINYVSRLLVLPLAALVFFAFTLKMKTINPVENYTGKTINVIIDAGHGGDDNGAISANNIDEKNITLAIAKKIKELNKNEKINIILSREVDKTMSVQERIKFANVNKADLFISVHIDAEQNNNTHSGLTLFIPSNDNPYLNQSKLLGTDIIESFKKNYQLPVPTEYKQYDKGVYVLKANQFPAVLIEGGFLTTQKDLDYLIKSANQEIIAKNILNGIEKYATHEVAIQLKNKTVTNDTTPDIKIKLKSTKTDSALIIVDGVEMGRNKASLNSISPNNIQSISVFKGEAAIKKYGDKGKNGVIEITMKLKNNNALITDNLAKITSIKINEDYKLDKTKVPLYIIGDKEITEKDLKNINPNQIQSISVLKGNDAIEKYGNKGVNGVIIITLKNEILNSDSIPKKYDKIFTKTEIEASFPGGQTAWIKFITDTITKHISELVNEGKTGTCHVKFIVGTDGKVSDVEAMDLIGTKLAEVCVNAIKTGPDWIPAKQNDHIVAAYRIQPITFTMQEQTTDKRIIKEGDNIFVHLIRDKNHEMTIKIPINNDGRIFFRGEYLMVKGLVFEDAKVLITNHFQKELPETRIVKIGLAHS